jgi:hypothetical protein
VVRKQGPDGLDPVRRRFSCDVVALMDGARQRLQRGGADQIAEAWRELLAAVASTPEPARNAPGCGLTQVADYNPYPYLAQVKALQRGDAPFRLTAVGELWPAVAEAHAVGAEWGTR